MKKDKLLLLCAMFSLFQANAQFKTADNVIISEKVNHDLYVAGGSVTINAPVYGDLVVAGGTIVLNDTITQDVIIAGGSVLVNKFVGDDIRCAGGKVNILGNTAGDLIVAGGEVEIGEKVVVDGNLYVSGGNAVLNGLVKGDVKSASGTFILNGIADNDVYFKGGKIVINGTIEGNSVLAANTITLTGNAKFNKNVRYWNRDGSLEFGDSVVKGTATFDESLEIGESKWYSFGFASVLIVFWCLLTSLLMILLVQYLFSKTMRNAARTVKNTTLKSVGLGFLFIITIPFFVVVLGISLVGLPIAIILALGYISILLLAITIVSVLIANWINNVYYRSSWKYGRLVLVVLLIFVTLSLVSLTPFIGPLIMLLLICMAFGGILQNIRWTRNNKASQTV